MERLRNSLTKRMQDMVQEPRPVVAADGSETCLFCPCNTKLSICGKYFPGGVELTAEAGPEESPCGDCNVFFKQYGCMTCGCIGDGVCARCR